MKTGQEINLKEKLNKIPVGLILILLIFLAVSLCFGHYKEYLYEDEVLSYTAANSLNGLRPKYERYTLTDGKEFVRNALAVDSAHRFDYANTARNTSDDPHPPFYLYLLHTISSLMPGIYSKWIALGINIVSGIVILIFSYLAASKIFKKKEQVYASVIMLAFSTAFMDKITFLRMYPMMTAFAMALFYNYLCLFENADLWKRKKTGLKAAGILLINVVAGTMTHYYFLIFAFFAAAFYSIWLLLKKNFRAFAGHLLTYVFAAASSLMIFPSMLWQISSSDPMSESSEGAAGIGVLISRAREMFIEFNLDFFNGFFKYFVLAFAALLIYILLYEKKRPEYHISEKILFTFVVSVGYLTLVSITTPYGSSRYLTPVYPLLVMILIYLAEPLIKVIFKDGRFGMAVLTVIFLFPLYQEVSAGLTDHNKVEMQRIASEYSDHYCITWSGMTLEENYFELEKYAGLFKIKLNDEEAPDEIDSRIADSEELVVYVPKGKDPQVYLDYLKRYVDGIDEYTLLYKAYYADAYLMN
ncbi:MAG: glycosyltransferase family 39 protein [Lachnospiraceae bacterium]|nr:glycosyltransferase family 39 protein [Lachnospiraceae bacterium]